MPPEARLRMHVHIHRHIHNRSLKSQAALQSKHGSNLHSRHQESLKNPWRGCFISKVRLILSKDSACINKKGCLSSMLHFNSRAIYISILWILRKQDWGKCRMGTAVRTGQKIIVQKRNKHPTGSCTTHAFFPKPLAILLRRPNPYPSLVFLSYSITPQTPRLNCMSFRPRLPPPSQRSRAARPQKSFWVCQI